MTTIAWDGTTLAADTLALSDCLKRRTSKLRVTDRFIYGMAGYESEGIVIARWLADGADVTKPPAVDDDGAKGIIIDRKSGRAFIPSGKSCAFLPVHEPFFAVGSGRDFAIAAMALGKSAEEAVNLAAFYDASTGGIVELATIDGGMMRTIERVDSAQH